MCRADGALNVPDPEEVGRYRQTVPQETGRDSRPRISPTNPGRWKSAGLIRRAEDISKLTRPWSRYCRSRRGFLLRPKIKNS